MFSCPFFRDSVDLLEFFLLRSVKGLLTRLKCNPQTVRMKKEQVTKREADMYERFKASGVNGSLDSDISLFISMYLFIERQGQHIQFYAGRYSTPIQNYFYIPCYEDNKNQFDFNNKRYSCSQQGRLDCNNTVKWTELIWPPKWGQNGRIHTKLTLSSGPNQTR